MYTLIIVLVILASILMIGIVLIQESKGGGLASGFSSSNQIMGVRKTTDFLEKATWTLAAAMVVLSVVSSAFVGRVEVEEKPLLPEAVPAQTAPASFPTAAPEAQGDAAPAQQPQQ